MSNQINEKSDFPSVTKPKNTEAWNTRLKKSKSKRRSRSLSPLNWSRASNWSDRSEAFKASDGRPNSRKKARLKIRSEIIKVSHLDFNTIQSSKIFRAGVIFYTLIGDALYYCFGKDSLTGDLTDFGGRKKKGEDPVHCAVRESNEETRYAFGKITPNQVAEFYCLQSLNMLIIFVPVISSGDFDVRLAAIYNFESKRFLSDLQKLSKQFNEISSFIWIHENQLVNLLSDQPYRFYTKVRKVFNSCPDFVQNYILIKETLKAFFYSVQEINTQTAMFQDIVSQDIVAQNVVSQDIVAQDIVAQDIVAQNVVSQNVVAQNVVSQKTDPKLELRSSNDRIVETLQTE